MEPLDCGCLLAFEEVLPVVEDVALGKSLRRVADFSFNCELVEVSGVCSGVFDRNLDKNDCVLLF